jgi:hypothetical protein
MDAAIQEAVSDLAKRFAEEVLAVVAQGLAETLDKGVAELPQRVPRTPRPRRSEADLGSATERILATLEKSSGELRSEELRAKSGMTRAAMGRPLKMLLASGRVRKSGEKRRTVYRLACAAKTPAPATAATSPAAGPAAKRAPGKAARKAAKAPAAKPKAKSSGKATASKTAKAAPVKNTAKAVPGKTAPTSPKGAEKTKAATTGPAKKVAAKRVAAKKSPAKTAAVANPAAGPEPGDVSAAGAKAE